MMKNLLFLFAALPTLALADIDVRHSDAVMFPESVAYRQDIPTPAEFLGFELGSEPVRHHQLVDYIRTVAGLSERLTVETIGYSHERRPILFVVATSTDNHGRLEDIRETHIALTEPDSGQAVEADMPVVTWLNYGVHGAESSGMDASLPFVYYLAAAEGDEIEKILEESVVLVTAIFNPDGHAKRIAWFDAYGGKRRIANPDHIEHQYSWRFARTNHYWFDLNRQWLLLTQPEARAWMSKWHAWRPNLTVDYHEMGSEHTYYFHPGVNTRTNPLVPDAAEVLMAKTAAYSEAVLDREGDLYFHGERFDNYYVGKGSTFPLVNGGVGILYEAAAALGRELETPNGLRTFRENIRKHFRTSIASIRAAVEQRADYLAYQKSFYTDALDDARSADTKAWIVSADGDTARLRKFHDLLTRHRIEAYSIAGNVDIDSMQFRAGESLFVPTGQPQYTLIRSLFETMDTFEDATFYDVSTWTLPPAFGLQAVPLDRRDVRGIVTREAAFDLAGTSVEQSGYGYVVEWSPYYAARSLYRILEQDVLARAASRPFIAETQHGDVSFGRGTVFVPLDRQSIGEDALFELMKEAAAVEGARVHAVTSGRSVNGTQGVNVGGPSFVPVPAPKILLLVGESVNHYDAGEIWHLLDYRMDIPVTLRDLDNLSGIDWSRYTHILLPSGNYDGVDEATLDRLRQWISEGGTAIGFRDTAAWLRAASIDYEPDLAPGDPAAVDEPEADEDGEPVERFDYGSKDSRDAVDVLGGAIFSGDLDITHPLGFGYERRSIALHKNFEEPLLPTDNPYAVVIEYTEQPLLSGYASGENQQAIASTPALIAERLGRGSVILFADNPTFRGYWYGTNKLLLNALFFSTAFEATDE